MADIRFVWWAGHLAVFHRSKTSAHRGFVYRSGRRKYGTIELTGLGWQFTTLAVTAASSGYSDSSALAGV